MNCRHCSQPIVKVYDRNGTYHQHNLTGLRFCEDLCTYAEPDFRRYPAEVEETAAHIVEESLERMVAGRPYCPITHSSIAHPRANLQFTNHVSITFVRDVNYCPTCGEKL